MPGKSAASAACLVLLAGGCALGTVPPEVEVAAVELRGVAMLDVVLGVTLCISNPNRTELRFRRVTVGLDVAGTPLAEGVSDAPVRLPPLDSVPVPFTVAVTARNLGPQLAGLARASEATYRLSGSVALEGGLGLTVPFSRSGRLGLADAGRALLADAAAPAGSRCAGKALPATGALM